MSSLTAVKLSLSAGLSFITGLLGGWTLALNMLLILIAADYVTGVFRAIKQQQLASFTGFTGILKKCVILIIVMVANCLDSSLELAQHYLRDGAIYFYSINEAISILENAATLGVNLPPGLTNILKEKGEALK
jgi:toxin secretion/phage lysis holin